MVEKKIHFNLKFTNPNLHKDLKILSAISGRQMSEIILTSIEKYLCEMRVKEMYQEVNEKEN